MDIPYIDKRSKQDVINYIKRVSKTYTPEWKFDTTNVDVGSAVALIYADMYYQTIKRFNRVAQKSMFDFFNSINIQMLPATASEGYVSFGLSSESIRDGVEVPCKTQLMVNSKGGDTIFQTLEDVLVSNCQIQRIYVSNGYNDVIKSIYTYNDSNSIFDIQLFDTSNEGNVQEHIVELYHDDVFKIEGNAYIGIKFVRLSSDYTNTLDDLETAIQSNLLELQYYSTQGYTNFLKVSVLDDRLVAYKSDTQAPFKFDRGFKVRLVSKSSELFSNRAFKRLECFSQSKDIVPDVVLTNEAEKNVNRCYPFDEKPLQYDEFYIASKDAFCKKGANIEVSFYTDFKKIPIQDEPSIEPEMEYKLIMKRSQFNPEPEYNITIDCVVWEYFNGKGWARLFKDNEYEDVFHPQNGRRTKTVSFICPEDIALITVGSKECYYIRAKVLKMSNRFKTKGYYITPVISEISINYYYSDSVIPNLITCKNNTITETFTSADFNSESSTIEPFKYLKDKSTELYFGFNYPLEYGPIRLLFCMKEDVPFETAKLKWSYLTDDGWKPLTVFDETENFRKTGVVTLIGNTNFKQETIFGSSLYWIKISDFQNEYTVNSRYLPTLKEVHYNAVSVINVVDMPEEVFTIEPTSESIVCKLSRGMVYSIEVWVNELSELTDTEIEDLKSLGIVSVVYDVFGMPISIWVKWQEVKDLNFSKPNDRHYRVDRNSGTIVFGDNVHGKIPSYKDGQTIKVKYSVGGGKSGNVEKYAISKINKTLGFVTNVYNPLITYGGSDIETVDRAIKRTACSLRSRNRAVTTFDYETLTLEAERSILKVKCIPNMRPDGTKSFGDVVLVILMEDYDKEQTYFNAVRERVKKYISDKMSGSVYSAKALHIVQPQYVYYNIKAEVSVKSFRSVFEVKSKIEDKIKEFLDVTTGNFDHKGWDIGVLSNSTQILNAIKNVEGVSYIKSIVITPYVKLNSNLVEVDINNIKGKEFALAFNGSHDIVITVD